MHTDADGDGAVEVVGVVEEVEVNPAVELAVASQEVVVEVVEDTY